MDIDMSDAERKKLAGIIESTDIANAMRPVINAMPQINANMASFGQVIQGLDVMSSITAMSNQWNAIASLTQVAGQYSCYGSNSAVAAALDSLDTRRLTEGYMSMQRTVDNLANAMSNVAASPFVDWISAVDFSPLQRVLDNLQTNTAAILKKAYLQTMYDYHWFPYAGIRADDGVRSEIDNIILSKRYKRKEARIDAIVLAYYTPAEIRKIKKECRASDLEPYIKKMIGQAMDAHLRGEYALSTCCLATLWEGLLRMKMPDDGAIENVSQKKKNKVKRQKIRTLIDDNGYDAILTDYYNNLITGDCYSAEDVIDDIPNRNGIAHGWYKAYPTEKASLNAILLTDFIIGLVPKDLTGE